MRRKIFSYIAISFAVLTLLGLSIPVVNAIEASGVGGRPANPHPDNPRTQSIFIYELEGGKSASDGVKVTNNTDQTRTLQVYAVDSQMASGGAFACEQKADPLNAVGGWVTLEKSSVTLAPKTNVTVNFTVRVPENTSVGEHNGCIVIQDSTEQKTDTNGVALSFRSAIRLVVTIPGEIIKKLSFVSQSVRITKDKLQAMPKFRNDGNVSLDVVVSSEIKSIFGGGQVSLGGQFPVLASSTAEYNFETDRPYWGGFYKVKTTATYNANPASGIGENGDSTYLDGATKTIWVMPRSSALAIELLVLAVIVFTLVFWRWRKQLKRYLTRNWTEYKVKKGENLQTIASAVGSNWRVIAMVNGLRPPYILDRGQNLKVPAKKSKKTR